MDILNPLSLKESWVNISCKLWKSLDCSAQAATASLTLGSDCVPCGSSIFVRIDVKGSPALRFLNHNAYAIGDSANVCCVDGQDYIDPAAALAEAGSQLLADPLITPFAREDSLGGVPAAVGAGTSASGNFFGAPTDYLLVPVKSTSGSGNYWSNSYCNCTSWCWCYSCS